MISAQSRVPIYDNLFTINKEIRERYNLFPEESKKIHRIEVYETYDEQYEVRLLSSGKIINTTTRKFFSPEEFEAFKRQFDESSPELEKAQIKQNFERRNRRSLNTGVFATSVVVHFPPVIPEINTNLDVYPIGLVVNTFALRLLLPMGITVTGFLINKNRNVHETEGGAYLSGSLAGRIKGEILSSALFSIDKRGSWGYSLVTGVVGIGEGVVSAAIANQYKLSSEQTSWAASGNIYGTLIGASIGYSIQNRNGIGMVLGSYAGSAAGTYFNLKNYPFLNLTSRGLQAVNMAGLIGGTLGLGTISFENPGRFAFMKTVLPASIFMATSAVALRNIGLRKEDADLFIYLPAVVGGAVGLGSILIYGSENPQLISSVGSSMALTWAFVYMKTYKNHYRRTPPIADKRQRKRVSYKFHPEGLLFHRLGENMQSWSLINQASPSILQLSVPLGQSSSIPIQYSF
jgi:hypothetical protein